VAMCFWLRCVYWVLCSVRLHGIQYKHHSLKHMLPQHCSTYNDVFYWLILQKRNFSKAQRKLPEDGPEGPKHVGANIEIF
jgi:hypothetical protein